MRDALSFADGMILEVCNTDEILADTVYVNSNLLEFNLLVPLQKMGEPILSMVNEWYYNGVIGRKDEIRTAAADRLLSLIPPHELAENMRGEMLLHARGRQQDWQEVKRDIVQLREMVAPRVCVLGHILRYMPDGRPMYWPPTFARQMARICEELGKH